MYIGYWQVVEEEEERESLVLFIPSGKQQCKVMPIRVLNTAQFFWKWWWRYKGMGKYYKETNMKNMASKTILLCVAVWAHRRVAPSIFYYSYVCTKTPQF